MLDAPAPRGDALKPVRRQDGWEIQRCNDFPTRRYDGHEMDPDAQSSAESQMKGLSLRNYPLVLGALRGERAVATMMSLLSPVLRESLAKGAITPSGWYPVSWKSELHRAGAEATGEACLARTMGYEMTRQDLTGIYRVFLRIVSPRYVLQVGSRIFSTYFRPGLMRVTDTRDGYARTEFTLCHGFDHNLWLDTIGGCEASLEVAGAKAPRLRFESGGRDGDTAAAVVAWWADAEHDRANREASAER